MYFTSPFHFYQVIEASHTQHKGGDKLVIENLIDGLIEG